MRTLALGLLAILIALGQSTPLKPAFEKADVHALPDAQGNGRRLPYAGNGRYELRSNSLLDLITTAYGVDPEKVVGGPNWLEWDHYDITAAMPPDTPAETQKLMLKTLLADRFKLVVHDGTKDLTSYVLTAGKNPKLKTSDGSGDTGCRGQIGGPGVTAMPGGGLRINQDSGPIIDTFTCTNMTMEAFATFLRGQVSQMSSTNTASPVVDQTELKGTWNFEFKTTLQFRMLNPGGAPSEQITILDAVDKQLGLKLTPTKTALPVIVVDSAIETPIPNLPGVAESLAIAHPKEFEVADVKPSDPNAPGGLIRLQVKPGGGVNFTGVPLQLLINQAYRPLGQQITPSPNLQEALQKRYDIIAKPPAQDSPVQAVTGPGGQPMVSPDDSDAAWAMVRALLADRFKLVVREEERPGSAYKLIAVKPKMKKADPAERTKSGEGPLADGKDPRTTTPSRSRLTLFQNVTMKQFAAALPGISAYMNSNTVVEDATGLEGSYDFTINYSPMGATNRNNGGGRGGPEGVPGPDGGLSAAAEPDMAITLFEAIEQQLGLKLVEEKRPVKTFVIDHVESKPTEN